MTPALMVLGCTSGAGKSLITTALCRWFRGQGVDVAPFKAQNISNNARAVDGGEIGVAQWLQARAARVEPTTDMNPVLVKPEADGRSQVIVDGRTRHDISAMPWPERGRHVWPAMTAAYDELADAHDLIVLEGAGSPAEINLPDLVNHGLLRHSGAQAVLVVDIDRGGAFAHLVGTWTLLADEARQQVAGFVINRFHGDRTLLAPGPALVAERTGLADLGVLPWLPHRLPDEEGGTVRGTPPADAPTVAIVRPPFASNLDEWHLLAHGAHLRWAERPVDLDRADLVILPGSKHVAADAAWIRDRGLDVAIRSAALGGVRVLGVCGGAMLLGADVADPDGVEGATIGLDLLPIRTVLAPEKLVRATDVEFPRLPHPWAALSGRRTRGYEIRAGRVIASNSREGDVARGPTLWARDNVLATTVHGLFENPSMVGALCGITPPPVLEDTFDTLAAAIDEHLDMAAIARLVGVTVSH